VSHRQPVKKVLWLEERCTRSRRRGALGAGTGFVVGNALQQSQAAAQHNLQSQVSRAERESESQPREIQGLTQSQELSSRETNSGFAMRPLQ
jgi:hypothetical protein